MADEAQVKLLKEKGVKAWNAWREADPGAQADLSNVDLARVELTGVDFRQANLNRADLSGAGLAKANLAYANLDRAILIEASLIGARLVKAKLSGANLNKTHLNFADLPDVDLKNATLRGAHLLWTNLRDADLSGGDLGTSNLLGTVLNRATLIDTDFSDCDMGEAVLTEVDLSRSKGLTTVKHMGPSSIGIDTIYRSGGKIPEVFLRGAGVPEPFIVRMKSLVAAMSPIEFYSCFISYSGKDQEFAERLNADLRSKNVRCWFAPEDLKIGDRLRPSFDEAIRVHDKLMVLLSENSVSSPWVEKEVGL